nr:hypothetical protein [Tanacetum cinerariifolium]
MSYSTISIPFDSTGKSVRSSPSLVILSDIEVKVMAIHAVLPKIALEAAFVVPPPTVTLDLAIEFDLNIKPSKAPPSLEYVVPPPPVQITPTSPTSPTEPASVGPSHKRCRSRPPVSATPPLDAPSPYRRSSLLPPDATAEAFPRLRPQSLPLDVVEAHVAVLRGLPEIVGVKITDLFKLRIQRIDWSSASVDKFTTGRTLGDFRSTLSSCICSLFIENLEPLRLDVLALKANDVSLFRENWKNNAMSDKSSPLKRRFLRWVEAKMVSPEVEMRNGEDFSCIRCVLPLTYQLMAVKKTSFPKMKCSGSKVSEKIEDSSQMVTSVSILEEPIKVANANVDIKDGASVK